jgi:hypothetical protein
MADVVTELEQATAEHRRLRGAFLDGMIRIEQELDEVITEALDVPVEDGRADLFQAVVLPEVILSVKIDIVEHLIEFSRLTQFSGLPSKLKQDNTLRNNIAHRAVWMRKTSKSPDLQLVFKGFRNGKEIKTTMSPTSLKTKTDQLTDRWYQVLGLRVALAAALGYEPPRFPTSIQAKIAQHSH